jgi:hypothetical protein
LKAPPLTMRPRQLVRARNGVAAMTKQPWTLFTCAVAMAVATGLGPAQAGSGERSCGRRVVAKGFPNKIKTVANLSALRIWSETVKDKHGADYAMWHNAKGSSIKCSPVQKSDYFMCIAMGRPCKMHAADAGTEKTAQHTQ